MEHTWLFHNLIVALGLLEECSAFPIHLGAGGLWSAGVASPLTPIALGAATLLAAAVLLLGCVCCRQQKGFQEFTDSVVSSQNNLSAAPTTSHQVTSELTLFPPLGTTLSQPGDRSSIVQFEPLPDIHVVAAAAAAARRKPAVFGNTLHHGLSVHDWFDEPIQNFPRDQLQYLREIGRGWFGRVVEGKAKEIISGHATSKVIVKILHEDATPTDQSYFLHEAKPYRSLKHPNVLSLVGRCLETHPFLLLLEDCSSGALKTFLAENRINADKLCQEGLLLEMARGVAAGLNHMVENGFVHTDLAARNCLVSSDLTVKVGDYGTSIETFKDEYYCVGDLAIPIRWVAPETIHCTDTTIETKEVTASANVWSLSVVLWEICEFGKLPYSDLSDEEVIEQVLGNNSNYLPFPSFENQPHVHNLYHLMKVCWVEAEKRPPLRRVVAMLEHLLQHKNSPAHTSANNNNNSTTSLDDFERRWELSKPNTVPKIDNQYGTTSMQSTPVKSMPLPRCVSMEGSVATEPVVQLELTIAADKACATPCANSPQLSVSSSLGGEMFVPPSLAAQKSPSLQNLRGSVDELHTVGIKGNIQDIVSTSRTPGAFSEEPEFDSWLKGMDTSTEEDVRFVRNISEAIRDLDEVLAQEKTSSSSQNSSSQPSPSQVTSRDLKPESLILSSQDQKFTLDFRLGQTAASSLLSRSFGLLHSNGHESLSLSQHRLESSGSDTEDETWRVRIERGEFSEKVKEKSKSVADLMVLTHIDYSDGSDSDTTLDLDPYGSSFRKNGPGRRSFTRKPLQSSSSVTYGSEGNIHQAILGEEFQETIKRLQESRRDGSKLDTIPDASLSYVSMSSNEAPDQSASFQTNSDKGHFLAKLASEKKMMKNDDSDPALRGRSDETNSISKHATHESMSTSSHLSHPVEINNCTYVIDNGRTLEQHPVNKCLLQEKSLLTSTPVSKENKLLYSKEEGLGLDSSLMCSQSLSFIESEKADSAISLSLEVRPLSPTPDEIQMKPKDSSCVILGPFEDSTLDYFKGLKTAFPAVRTLDYVSTETDLEENTIETWDKFLDHAMQPEYCDYPSFSEVNLAKVESESPVSDAYAPSDSSDILGSSFEKSVPEKTSIPTNGIFLQIDNVETIESCSKGSTPSVLSNDVPCPKNTTENFTENDIVMAQGMSVCEGNSNLKQEGSSTSCLVVPSVNVIAATPVSSGRNTPNDLKTEAVDPIILVTKEYDDLGLNEDVNSRNVVVEDGKMDLKNYMFSMNATVEFAAPQLQSEKSSVQNFDPDLPCCNQSNQNFDRSEKSYNINNEFDLFSNNGLATDCFVNSKLDEDFIGNNFKPVMPLFSKGFDPKEADTNGEIMEDEDEFGLGVAKNLTPDDERSSDSGFRDKGSLSESCEDACDEKYNLEDIEAELEEAFSKGVFARHDSPTSTKGQESDCEPVDESFSVTLTDVEKQREQREAEINLNGDPCHRLDVLLRSDQVHEPLAVDVESSVDFFGTSPALSPIPQSSGWFLHPQNQDEAEPISGNDSSYFSFSLDEEFVNAIRNELREKLPLAQMQREESQPQLSDEEENSDEELDSEESQMKERTNIMIHYKAPLSPIFEERESICSESCSPLGGCNTSSCSEQSPVLAVERSPSQQGDGDIHHGESEGPAEVDGDLSDDCGDGILYDELNEHDTLPQDGNRPSPSKLSMIADHDLCLNADDNDDYDDVLVVNMETNEATILESPKPVSKYSFGGNDEYDDSNHDDFVPDFLSVAGSYQLPESKLNNGNQRLSELYLSSRPLTLATLPQSSIDIESEDENDDNAMTPDSITCEKSFSERTEDSALGLAMSEVMTPDSLTGESQWTSAQMCDSGFGTIGTRPSSVVLSTDGCDQNSPELNANGINLEDEYVGTLDSREETVLKPEVVEMSETTHSMEDSESSVSVSSNSVVAVTNVSNDDKSIVASLHSDLTHSNVKIQDVTSLKENVETFIAKETEFSACLSQGLALSSPTPTVLSPQSLKEMAESALGNDRSFKVHTLAFNAEETTQSNISFMKKSSFSDKSIKENGHLNTNGEHMDCGSKILKPSHLSIDDPLQTLAFSDGDMADRRNFSGPGHIVVSSIMAQLTPNEENPTSGMLAFNDSPESPCEMLSPIVKENDSTEAESHLMSTSFMSADDLYDDRDQFTHDWESGSDGCESETASSSSGEFIWKDGDRESSVKAVQAAPDSVLTDTLENQAYSQTQTEFPMSSILEEDEDGSASSSCTSDSEDDAEFVPSAWNSQATPSRSALRSPDKKVDQKKNVSFKRQRYHCVYEYPRELSDSDGSEFADSPSRRRTWDVDCNTYNLHDWDIAINEGMAETPCQEDLRDEQPHLASSPSSQRLYEFYKMNSADYGFGSTMLSEDGEFFISSSAQPFHTLGEAGPSGSSEFFPGRGLTASSVDDSDVVDGILDQTPADDEQIPSTENQNWRHTEEFSDSDSSDTNMVTASEGSFSQQRSGDSNSSSTPMVTANGSSKSSEESSVYHSIPTHQELQVDSGSDSPLSELSPTSPLSPISPSHGLGELRHTRDRLKLDLPVANAAFMLVAPNKKKSVEQVKGEASLLDGEEVVEGGACKASSPCLSDLLSSDAH